MIPRELQEKIEANIPKGKIILLMGARQTGKTTLLEKIKEDSTLKSKWFNADEPDIRDLLQNATSTKLKSLFGDNELIIIDEAQRVQNIGLTLKLINDNLKNYKVIATGSSALELNQVAQEPLTGRKHQFNMFPISFHELVNYHGLLEEKRLLNVRLIYGSYPEVINNQGNEKEILKELSNSYLFKDLLIIPGINKPDILLKILRLLALQVGSEVSYHEIGRELGVSSELVEKYISLLEKSFIIFRLPTLGRNLKNELKKSKKIYFYDNGIMNALNASFSNIETRKDVGALWENYLISERIKYLEANQIWTNQYFWRTFDQQEIDYIEERDSTLYAFEFKWNPNTKKRFSKTFTKNYPDHQLKIIHRDNYESFLLI